MRVEITNRQRLIRINLQNLKKTALKLLRLFNFQEVELGLVLVNDRSMKRMNSLYRGIHKTTDVLSFPIYNNLREIPKNVAVSIGDIVISLSAVRRHASEYGCTFNEELQRLLVHGFLHLLGFDHEKNAYQEKKMKEKEKELLYALKALD